MTSHLPLLVISFLHFLTPLLFWTLTPNLFATPKQLLFLGSVTLLFLLYGAKVAGTKTLPLPRSNLTLPLILFALAITLNLIFIPEGRAEALAGKGSTLLLLPIFSLLLLTQTNSRKLLAHFKLAFYFSTFTLAIHSLLHLTYLHTLTNLPLYMQNLSFTPTGSYLTTLTLLLLSATFAFSDLKYSPRHKHFLISLILLTALASFLILSQMLPGRALAPATIPLLESWTLSLDALKSTRSLLFGVGLANFSSLYTSAKPLSLNYLSSWNTLPQHGSSELLSLLATTGLTGTLTFLSLMFKGFLNSRQTPLALPYLLASLALFFTPGSLPLYLIFFMLLITLQSFEPSSYPLRPNLGWILGLAILLNSLVLGYLQLKPYLAEYHMRQAQLALTQNDSRSVYEHHLSAISHYPHMTNYHLSFAEVSFRLASSLSQKPDLTDADRDNVSRLIQQSIQEAKTAINLRPNAPSPWITLAKIYRNLIGVAEGSEEFAIQAYSQAIALDPANPSLRLDFGGLFYQLAQLSSDPEARTTQLSRAIQEFQIAIRLKRDYANAYYNLAKTYELASLNQEAKTALEQAILHTDPDSPDYPQTLAELESLKTKLISPAQSD